jgi:hypothetical protein
MVFSTAQPKYAALGIATFPFDATQEVKRGPMVSRYDRMGLPASKQMALRFPDAPGLAAMAGARNRFTVIDIDERGAAGERLLADMQRQFGNAKVVVRTGSGGFHAYYRHAGEGRKIRPDPRKPIDLIGGGPIVLPPSRGFRGNYEIIHGRVEDLAVLKPIQVKSAMVADSAFDPHSVLVGERDAKFFPYIKRSAHQAKSYEDLLDHAREINGMMPIPLPDAQVVAKCKHWWRKTERGENKWGVGQFTTVDHATIDGLMMRDLDAFTLLMFLERNHWGREFTLANETRHLLPLNGSRRGQNGWDRERFAGARTRLITGGHLIVVREATRTPPNPMICRLRNQAAGISAPKRT